MKADGNVGVSQLARLRGQVLFSLFIPPIVSPAQPIASLFQSPASQKEVQEAVQWWQQRRSIQSQRQADEIRDHLLQELFGLYRGLELAALSSTDSAQHQQWLDKIARLQRSLETLSYQLSPPYLDASLTLAIQYEVEQWKVQYPQIDFQLDLAQIWEQDAFKHNQIIVAVLNEWLRLNLPWCDESKPIAIVLQYQDHSNTLTLHSGYCFDGEPETTPASAELRHLHRVFELLMPGKIEVRQQEQMTVWYFCWKWDDRGSGR